MRILIIGGSGFLSGTVARAAAARGYTVTAVTRGRRPLPPGVTAIVADRQDRAGFARQIAALDMRWDLVVDAIAYVPGDAVQDVEVFAGRTRRLVFVSTDFIYDPLRRTVPQLELASSYAETGYGGQKRAAERILERTPTTTLPWTILRPSHIYGPGSLPGCLPLHGRDPRLVERIHAGEVLRLVAGGRRQQHPIFAPDLAETILDAATAHGAIGKTLNVAGPDIIASSEYFHVLGKLLGREVAIETVDEAAHLAAHPEHAPYCCERVYDLTALRESGFALPKTRLEEGLRSHLDSLPQTS